MPIDAVKLYLDFPPKGVSFEMWTRDLKTIRCLGELCELRIKDLNIRDGLLWIRINRSKTDQLAKKFVPIK